MGVGNRIRNQRGKQAVDRAQQGKDQGRTEHVGQGRHREDWQAHFRQANRDIAKRRHTGKHHKYGQCANNQRYQGRRQDSVDGFGRQIDNSQ